MTHSSASGAPVVAVLCLPGMTLSGSIFPPLPAPTVEVDFNRLVVSPDGELPHRSGLATHAAALLDHLSRDPVWAAAGRRVAVAHSFGGMLVLHCLLEKLLRLDGMVLIATTAGPMFDVVGLRLFEIGGRTIRIPFAPLLPVWNSPVVTRLAKRAFTGGRLSAVETVDFRKLRTTTDFTVDAAGWRNTDWRAMRSYRLAMKGFDVRDQLESITVPAIVLHGTRDSLFPTEVGRALAEGLPNARYREVEGAGHALPLTHGQVVREAVEEIS